MHPLVSISCVHVTHANSKYSSPLLVTAMLHQVFMLSLIPLLTYPVLWLFRQKHSEAYICLELPVEKNPEQHSILLYFQDECVTDTELLSHLLTIPFSPDHRIQTNLWL